MDSTRNRVAEGIEKCAQRIQDRLEAGLITEDQIKSANKKLDLQYSEYSTFQNLKSIASTDGTLTLDEAQLIYMYLGNTLEHFNKQSMAVKTVMYDVLAMLLKKYHAK